MALSPAARLVWGGNREVVGTKAGRENRVGENLRVEKETGGLRRLKMRQRDPSNTKDRSKIPSEK